MYSQATGTARNRLSSPVHRLFQFRPVLVPAGRHPLRVRSITTPLEGGSVPPEAHGEVDCDDTPHADVVIRDQVPVGTLEMARLVMALVPRVASEAGARKY